MGKRIVIISPDFLQEMITQGHTIGRGDKIVTEYGLPEGARFLRAWYDGAEMPDGVIVMLFEHDLWSDTEEGQPFEVIMPRFRTTHE